MYLDIFNRSSTFFFSDSLVFVRPAGCGSHKKLCAKGFPIAT